MRDGFDFPMSLTHAIGRICTQQRSAYSPPFDRIHLGLADIKQLLAEWEASADVEGIDPDAFPALHEVGIVYGLKLVYNDRVEAGRAYLEVGLPPFPRTPEGAGT